MTTRDFNAFARMAMGAKGEPLSGALNVVNSKNLSSLPDTVLLNVLGRMADTEFQANRANFYAPTADATPAPRVENAGFMPPAVAGRIQNAALETPFRAAPKSPLDI